MRNGRKMQPCSKTFKSRNEGACFRMLRQTLRSKWWQTLKQKCLMEKRSLCKSSDSCCNGIKSAIKIFHRHFKNIACVLQKYVIKSAAIGVFFVHIVVHVFLTSSLSILLALKLLSPILELISYMVMMFVCDSVTTSRLQLDMHRCGLKTLNLAVYVHWKGQKEGRESTAVNVYSL